jgi:hypothetical protein
MNVLKEATSSPMVYKVVSVLRPGFDNLRFLSLSNCRYRRCQKRMPGPSPTQDRRNMTYHVAIVGAGLAVRSQFCIQNSLLAEMGKLTCF